MWNHGLDYVEGKPGVAVFMSTQLSCVINVLTAPVSTVTT
jgi:hypothetical protein